MQKATLHSLPGPNFPAITRNTLDGRPVYNEESGLPLIPSKCVRSLVYPAKCGQYADMPGWFWWELWQIFAIFSVDFELESAHNRRRKPVIPFFSPATGQIFRGKTKIFRKTLTFFNFFAKKC